MAQAASIARPGSRSRGRAATLLDLAALSAGILAVARWTGALSGFPKGYDAFAHVAKVHIILSTFPHIWWNWTWYSGAQNFVGGYPPGYDGYHAVVALVVWATGSSVNEAINAVGAASLVMIVTGVYGLVRVVSESRLGGLLAAALVFGGPTQWDQILRGGLYPRLFGWGCASLALCAAATYARRGGRVRFVLTVVLLALASFDSIAEVLAAPAVVALVVLMSYERPGVLRRVVGLGAATFGLVACLYLPSLVSGGGTGTFMGGLAPLGWGALIGISHGALGNFSPILLPVVVFSVLVAVLVRRHLRDQAFFVAAVFALIGLGLIGYCVIGHLDPGFHYYVNGTDTTTVLCYPEWYLAAAVGISLGRTAQLRPWQRRNWVPLGIGVAAALLGIAVTVPVLRARTTDYQSAATNAVEAVARSLPQRAQLRVVVDNVGAGESLDVSSDLPQFTGYPVQSELYPNWEYWAFVATSEPGWNAEERRFLLDWYGAGWILSSPGAESSIYASRPSDFTTLRTSPNFQLFRVNHELPIVTASTAPTVVVIGDLAHYDLVLHSLAEGDLGSTSVVPIWGGEYVDGVEQSVLARADAVLLYGAKSHDPSVAADELDRYVRAGGRLVIDSGHEPLDTVLSSGAGSPVPVSVKGYTAISGRWDFKVSPGSGVTASEVAKFSPPSYASSDSWQVEAATGLQPWAHAILTSHGHVVLAGGRLGSGLVDWSGMNLPYHIASYQSANESKFLGTLLGVSTRDRPGSLRLDRFNPEDVQASAQGKGLLVKESFAKGWAATVDGKPEPVELAGPGMMYVPFPSRSQSTNAGAVQVDLHYSLTNLDLAGLALSAAVAAALIIFLLPWPRVRRRPSRSAGRLKGQVAESRREHRRGLREELHAALTESDPRRRADALELLADEPLEPYADLLLRFTLTEQDPLVLDLLVRLGRESESEPASSADLEAFRTWASRQPVPSPAGPVGPARIPTV